jgi:hypothetical protein
MTTSEEPMDVERKKSKIDYLADLLESEDSWSKGRLRFCRMARYARLGTLSRVS